MASAAPAAGALTAGALGAMVSTLKVLVLLAGDTLFAASVAVACTACVPSPRAVTGVQVKTPAAVAVVLQTAAPSTRTATVLLASAVPLYVGVAVESAAPFAGAETTGAAGLTVSTMKEIVLLAGEMLPAASAAMALTEWAPWLSAVTGVQLNVPAARAVVEHTVAPSTEMVTVLPASAVPLYVGVAVESVAPLAGVATTGATGITVSTVKEFALLTGDTLPAASVAMALTEWAPWLSAVAGVQLKVPAATAVVEHTVAPSTETVTVLPASAVPLYAGVAVLSVLPADGAVTAGASGTMVSTVKVLVLLPGEALFAASVAVA